MKDVDMLSCINIYDQSKGMFKMKPVHFINQQVIAAYYIGFYNTFIIKKIKDIDIFSGSYTAILEGKQSPKRAMLPLNIECKEKDKLVYERIL